MLHRQTRRTVRQKLGYLPVLDCCACYFNLQRVCNGLHGCMDLPVRTREGTLHAGKRPGNDMRPKFGALGLFFAISTYVNYQNLKYRCIYRARISPKSVFGWELTTLRRPPSWLGRGTSLPWTLLVSRSRRLAFRWGPMA